MRHTLPLSLLLTILAVIGCGGQKLPSGMAPLVKVSITVTQDGKSLGGATVTLFNMDGTVDYAPSGRTDSSGIATMYTQGNFLGAPLGKYKVCITKTEGESNIPKTEAPTGSPEYMQALRENKSSGGPKTIIYTEEQYGDPRQTPHEIDVTGKCSATFDVGKPVKITKVGGKVISQE